MKHQKQIVLIDGKWLGYVQHFAHMSLKTSDGKPTGMLHGFLNALLRINRRLPEARIIICWDGKGKTWRHDVFPEYKGNRSFNPEFQRMQQQIDVLLPILRKLGLWVLRWDGVEADDMIGMAAKLFSQHGYPVRIHSSDRDMYQLVDNLVSIWPDIKQPPLKIKDIENWLGAPMEALLDIRAMAGDPGDNLKGLPGVGMKTAVKMWKQGFRVSTMKISHIDLCAKFRKDLSRVHQEFRLARIVTDYRSSVWTRSQEMALGKALHLACVTPERDVDGAESHRKEVYEFLAEYELQELMAERHKLFRLP